MSDSSRVRVLRPLQDFIRTEAASGLLLILAVIAALVWANSPWSEAYHHLWETESGLQWGGAHFSLTLHHWINEGLMTLFFFVVGLEVKREFTAGELRDPRRAALPVLAAVGGMVVPALIFIAFNAGTDTVGGWGVPMATDIAIALGVLSLLGSRVPTSLKVFLLTLAIVDDIGAVIVIAVVYSGHSIHFSYLLLAAALLAVSPLLRRLNVRWKPLFLLVAIGVWLAVYSAGIHATLAGVALGLLTSSKAVRNSDYVDGESLADVSSYEAAHETATLARDTVSSVEWLQHLLHPWVSYVILPLFALSNAGVHLSRDGLQASLSSTVTLGVFFGLVIGKIVGISGFAWIAVRFGIGKMPTGVTAPQIVGAAAMAGIGFTVAMFVTDLAFTDASDVDAAKLGVLIASVVAGILGALLLLLSPKRHTGTSSAEISQTSDQR